MVTTEQYHQKLEETADRVKAVFDAISTYTKALDDIPHKVFKDQLWSVSGRCDEAAGANGFNVTLNAQPSRTLKPSRRLLRARRAVCRSRRSTWPDQGLPKVFGTRVNDVVGFDQQYTTLN